MPNPYFLIFELIIYLELVLCLRHAWKNGPQSLLKLLLGVVFGVLLELATLRQLNAYHYGRFIIMVFDVPLCIGIAWSCIIYSVMEFSDAAGLSYFLRPVLDGLLALNIDLALDVVAIRLGFWGWGRGLEFQYFGVPYANFWAWFWVVFSFSFGFRLLSRRTDFIGTWLSAPLALVIGLIGVLGTNALIAFVVPRAWYTFSIAFVILGALFLVFIRRPALYQRPVGTLSFWIPFLNHAYLLIAGLISGVILNPPFLLAVSLAMLVIALALHSQSLKLLFDRLIIRQSNKPV